MEDETHFKQSQQLLRDHHPAFGAARTIYEEDTLRSTFGSHNLGYSSYSEKTQSTTKGLELKKRHRFPFTVTSFECVGKRVVIGSDQGTLYAYQIVQNEQSQSFKLLFHEPNAHHRSQIHKLLNVSTVKSKYEATKLAQKGVGENNNLDYSQYTMSHSNNQMKGANVLCGYHKQSVKEERYSSNYLNNTTTPNTSASSSASASEENQQLQSIISCGYYDKKLILWEMNQRFEKKAQSQMFKTFIYNLGMNENFVFVGTFKKIYALSLSSLVVCMKFGVPHYKQIDFQITSVACLPLTNSNMLIAGTDSYKGGSNFISLWEHSKEYTLPEDDYINDQIEEEQAQPAPEINDIEDLDNFDLDGDFDEAPTEQAAAKPQKKNRLSFWKPNLLEHCHSSRIRQLKCFKNSPQFISVSITEIHIWRILEGVQSQVQQQQQVSFQNQLPSQYNFGNIFSQQATNTQISFNQLIEMPIASQVFSLQFNNERKIQTNVVIEKESNNILMFIDSEVLSFDSKNFTLNYHQNLHSQNQISLLYLNSSNSSSNNNNSEDIQGRQQFINSHSNHYVLVNNPNNDNLITQFATKFTIATCEFEQVKPRNNRRNRAKDNKNQTQNTNSQQLFSSSNESLYYQLNQQQQYHFQEEQKQSSDVLSNSSDSYILPIQESRIEEEEEEDTRKSPKITPRSKKMIQSPILKTLSQIPTSVPPVNKYSTAHIIPSTASYTILMNKLKQIEQTNNASKQHNQCNSSLRRASQSSVNIPAITFRKPFTGVTRSNSKCIKKQLKRHVKYNSNKKKKMKQSLVKVFANQISQNMQSKELNSQSLTLIQASEKSSQNASELNTTIQTPQQQQLYQQQIPQLFSTLNGSVYPQTTNSNNINNNQNIKRIANASNIQTQTQKTFIVAQDSEISLGFYTIS